MGEIAWSFDTPHEILREREARSLTHGDITRKSFLQKLSYEQRLGLSTFPCGDRQRGGQGIRNLERDGFHTVSMVIPLCQYGTTTMRPCQIDGRRMRPTALADETRELAAFLPTLTAAPSQSTTTWCGLARAREANRAAAAHAERIARGNA
jgi:hypothetical protein